MPMRSPFRTGAWVVCDRFSDSTRAYQGAAGGVPRSVLDALEDVVVGPTRPDLTLVLDLAPEVGLARARARSDRPADRFEGEDLAFHEALRAALLDIAAEEPGRCVVIDAARPAEAVAEDIWGAVHRRLSP